MFVIFICFINLQPLTFIYPVLLMLLHIWHFKTYKVVELKEILYLKFASRILMLFKTWPQFLNNSWASEHCGSIFYHRFFTLLCYISWEIYLASKTFLVQILENVSLKPKFITHFSVSLTFAPNKFKQYLPISITSD